MYIRISSFSNTLYPNFFHVFRPIKEENVGRKMLEKMGWKEGEGLGREGAGRLEPVRIYEFFLDKDTGVSFNSSGLRSLCHIITLADFE